MRADILRDKFLDFFKSKKHKIVESDLLAPKDDPTVLFTPAGMNQFKKEFLGFDSGFRRAATCQRCLRTDDLDKVGKTSGHHTFFEMLGNFSFGDYFKKEAIAWAWEFLTETLKIKNELLWVSVYREDDEAYNIWLKYIKVPEQRIIKLGDKENFWPSEAKEKGPNGPCGPCSEIFFDQGSSSGCGRPDCNPSCSCGRFVEVWNLVFTQFNRREGGILEPLPHKNIDTGMGLERLAALMQGVRSNFETDLFRPMINELISGLPTSDSELRKELLCAIADHARAVTFSIYDGILPSNETRGYVVRKLIRKSALHLRTLGTKQPLLYRLVAVLAESMSHYYPELNERKENISEVILAEEKAFINTLESSDNLFKEKFQLFVNKQDPGEVGRIAFQLYDTYGIPLELSRSWLDKQGVEISLEAFNKELTRQKERSKLQSAMKGDVFDVKGLGLGAKKTKFLGYKDNSAKAKIIKILKDSEVAKRITKGQEAAIILDATVFYPEAGGQVGDTGWIKKGKNEFEVNDTQKIGQTIIHTGIVREGSFKNNDLVFAVIDAQRRLSIARNHTATHLLQAALRKVLGPHVRQQGSLVAEDRLRFDFTHFKDIDTEQLNRIEEVVNGYVIDNVILKKKKMTLSGAKKTGALAFFGEKYENEVRVVTIEGISKELCAGTHLDSTGQIGAFFILQEGSVASGTRRIEAACGMFAYRLIKKQEQAINDASGLLGVPRDKITQEIEKKNLRIKELEKRINLEKLDSIKSSVDSLIQAAEAIKGIKVIARVMENLDMNLLRKNVDLIKEKTANAVIALGAKSQERALLVIGVTEDLCQRGLDASVLIRDVAKIISGSGGGRKDFAQAGGTNPANFELAFMELKNIITKLP